MAAHCFQDMRFFVCFMSFLIFVEMIGGVYFRSALTTIERRFELSTTMVAMLSSTFQIGNLTVMMFVSYYGSRSHRPRAISIGSSLVAAGFLIACLPQFIGDRYEYVDTMKNSTSSSNKQVQMCKMDGNQKQTNVTCNAAEDDSSAPANNLYILIVVGMALSGIGAAPLQPLGMSYIDDHSTSKKSPVYIGIVLTVALIGPAFGFLLGAAILLIWVDAGWVDTSEIDIPPRHPSWVGAWWLGFLLCGILIAIATIPICFFPRKMKKPDEKISATIPEYPFNEENEKKIENDLKSSDVPSAIEKGGILKALKRLFTRIEYIMMIMMWVCGGLSIVGVITFFPKYLEVQFGISASKANMYYGAIAIPCLAVGTMLGGFIMKRRNPSRLGMIKIVTIARIAATLCVLPIAFLGCSSIDIAGITVPYPESNYGDKQFAVNSYSQCNSDCYCTNGTFSPICGSDGITYLTPCHAGCQNTFSEVPGQIQNYTECSCVHPTTNGNINDTAHWSFPQRCERSKCADLVLVILVLKAAASLAGGVGATPGYIFLMRSVSQADKAFGIGIAFMVTRILAWIPGPMIYGKAIDSTCLYWATSSCSDKGYCRVYDSNAYRTTFYSIIVGADIGACICCFIICCLVKNKSNEGDIEDEYKAAKNKENEVLLKEPSSSFRAAARLASETGSERCDELKLNEKTLLQIAEDAKEKNKAEITAQ
ncbi:solute carrier organic anion transporter family member 2A1-like [Styela clava]